MIPQKLQDVGCTSTNTHTSYRGEFIYIQNGCYYPTICNGYKDAAKCTTLEGAQSWIDEKKKDGRGGARPNSGRPRKDNVYLHLRIPRASCLLLKKKAEDEGLTASEYVIKKLNL